MQWALSLGLQGDAPGQFNDARMYQAGGFLPGKKAMCIWGFCEEYMHSYNCYIVTVHCYSPYEERKKRLNDFWVKLQSEILKFNAMICAIQLHLLDCDRVFVLGPYKKCVCVSGLCKTEKIQYQVINLKYKTKQHNTKKGMQRTVWSGA